MDEYRTYIIVIGSGAAGLRASSAASERGAEVVLLAKGTAGLGTATILSYGALAAGGFGKALMNISERQWRPDTTRTTPIL
jgi:succinate dehydrogenase/fumarate reductase flavoprotein subunit